jgi:3-isopropylmalate/(R)-2-methylmalate dehydratase small subunit
MQPFTTLTGIAMPIDEANVDTNQLCPTRFNKVPRGPKYAEILFYDQRVDTTGARTEFPINRPPYDKAQLIVADSNFGCGSSRETAVYALYEFGIRCVIAPSFGDIFDANCAKNGLLTIALAADVCARLRALLREHPGMKLDVDLEAQTVTDAQGGAYRFDIAPIRKRCLINGFDDIARTQEYAAAIAGFETAHRAAHPWMFAATPDAR